MTMASSPASTSVDHAKGVRLRPERVASPPNVEREPAVEQLSGFQHELFFYAGEEEFLAGTLPLIEQALRRQRPVLAAVAPAKLSLLRAALGERAGRVELLDMHELGRNPARIIPAWQQFLEEYRSAGPALGIGEPVWPGRSAAELGECERHESLLNLAFAGRQPWRLVCAYDRHGLDAASIEAAQRNHPFVAGVGSCASNPRHRDARCPQGALAGELPEPSGPVRELGFGGEQLPDVRRLVAGLAADATMAPARAQNLVLAVGELAANSVRHGGGGGTVRVWQNGATLLCEVRDAGRIEAPLAGRIKPRPDQLSGRGLWLVHQLCDLAQVRSDDRGTVVRVHADLPRRD